MIMLELCEGGGAKYAEGGAKLGSPPPSFATDCSMFIANAAS